MNSTFPRIAETKDYILTAILLLLSLVLLIDRNEGGLNKLRTASITIFSYLQEPLSQLRVYQRALKSNNELRRQNIMLLDQLNKLRSAQTKNQELRGLLNLSRASDFNLYPAQIIGKELNKVNSLMTVDAGSSQGIKKGMPMISAQGLLGQVVLTSNHYAQIMPLYNRLFRVSAKLQHSNAYGIVQWNGRNTTMLELQYIPQTIPVDTGEIVLTSGYSNKFPPNIPIGKVVAAKPNKGKNTQKIYVQPFVNLYSVSAGFIITNKQDSTLRKLNTNYQKIFK